MGEINTDGSYYQAGGRSIRCAGCGRYYEYGEVSLLPPVEPTTDAEGYTKPKQLPRARPVADGPKLPPAPQLRRHGALIVLASAGLFVFNLIRLFSAGRYFPIIFALAPFMFVLGSCMLVVSMWKDANEAPAPLGCFGGLAAVSAIVFGLLLAFFPVEVLQWIVRNAR